MATLSKLAAIARAPRTWRALSVGVAATMEHRTAFGDRAFASVIDIGANKGQFAAFAMNQWPQAALYCFEPLATPRGKLEKVTAGRARIFPCALGEADAEADIHIATREDSSSMLPLGELQEKLFSMREAQTLKVPVRTLDGCLADCDLKGPILLKIDVQGFERQVLAGATATLARVDAAYIELSYVELYKGQALADEVVAYLGAHGLKQDGVFNKSLSPEGVAIQADFLFRRA